jgi:D-ornithine 4,5-aminomutase subunit beta
LDSNEKLDIETLLKDLESYVPRRKGWVWREPVSHNPYSFPYIQISSPLMRSAPLPASANFDFIDPQPDCTITCEIASGRFEDDLRRMRMAAWHGADHIMVIRTLGQSHYDGLIEGTPQGIGGIPITRKQIRATRKALDIIEDEVGRPINLHSYVSGLAGPEMALMFAEEGISGAHQDFQYNILYRNINMHRSIVDSAAAKYLMARSGILQIDGAHNANATAINAWKIMPELLVQHAINTRFSQLVGMPDEMIALSTVPPTAPPLPKLTYDLPYAIAIRFLFRQFRFRAQQNTRYSGTNLQETAILHVLDTFISRLTSVDIQSTIPPDEARNVPWHYHSIQGVNGAKQTLQALDGISDLVSINMETVRPRMRDLIIRAIMMLEDIRDSGGYFEAVEEGFFVDSGLYPEYQGDGIRRSIDGGVGAGTVFPRSPDYYAPVCDHFGLNALPEAVNKPCDLINGCTLCDRSKIQYIDELDQSDTVQQRLEEPRMLTERELVVPEAEFAGDGIVTINLFIPLSGGVADKIALEMARKMNLDDLQILDKFVLHPAEGTHYEIKGTLGYHAALSDFKVEESITQSLSFEEIRSFVRKHKLKVVGATLGNDEHSVGLHEIMDIKHGGLEKYGFECLNIGTSVMPEKLLDVAIEYGACAVLASLIISHQQIHRINMRKLVDIAVEKGVRDKFLFIAGGTHLDQELALECGLDAGFGPGTKGEQVAQFIVSKLLAPK